MGELFPCPCTHMQEEKHQDTNEYSKQVDKVQAYRGRQSLPRTDEGHGL